MTLLLSTTISTQPYLNFTSSPLIYFIFRFHFSLTLFSFTLGLQPYFILQSLLNSTLPTLTDRISYHYTSSQSYCVFLTLTLPHLTRHPSLLTLIYFKFLLTYLLIFPHFTTSPTLFLLTHLNVTLSYFSPPVA